MTETELVFKRSQLRHVLTLHPEWTGKDLGPSGEHERRVGQEVAAPSEVG